MMEIKTTNQIVYQDLVNHKNQLDEESDKVANSFRGKKWVSVDDIKSIIPKGDVGEELSLFIIELLDKLKGE